MHLYLAVYPLFWLVLIIMRGMKLASTGELAGWAPNRMPVNDRLRRYLARGLAWLEMDFSGALERLQDVMFFTEA
jgi:hypothetical protein